MGRFIAQPQFKVNITHSGSGTDYVSDVFPVIRVKRRECNYDTATLDCSETFWEHYETDIAPLDEIKIYFKSIEDAGYTQVFGGYIRKALPAISGNGYITQLQCKGYGATLEITNCNRDYGAESANPTYPQPHNALKNIIADFVNKRFAGAATGWSLVSTYVSDYVGTDMTYVNNPYLKNIDVVNLICDIATAIGAGATAGPHWIVDNSKRFLCGKIGDHAAGGTSPETYWPDWWNTDLAGSTLTQGDDFSSFQVLDNSEEFANNVVLITDLRKPTYDYWTENHAALWGTNNLVGLSANAGTKVVGTHSIKIEVAAGNTGNAYFPSGGDAGWDVEKWGSAKTIPRFNFYLYSNANVTGEVRLFTTDYNNDYFTLDPWSLFSDPTNEWTHHSIPIGPYWASTDDAKKQNWTANGAADWGDINGFSFHIVALGGGNAILYVDDAHFTGKIIRSAYNSTDIAANNEYQKVFFSQVTMDDSAVATDDSGTAARLAAAELLRRQSLPFSVTFSTNWLAPALMAGQMIHVNACKKSGGSYAVDSTMRVLELEHVCAEGQGGFTNITATADLLNSHPISRPDQWAILMENTLVNSKDAKDIRASSDVDLLIPILSYDYG